MSNAVEDQVKADEPKKLKRGQHKSHPWRKYPRKKAGE